MNAEAQTALKQIEFSEAQKNYLKGFFHADSEIVGNYFENFQTAIFEVKLTAKIFSIQNLHSSLKISTIHFHTNSIECSFLLTDEFKNLK